MGKRASYKFAGFGIVGILAMTAATQASASPCGGAYAVDAPTTLSRVARACNVSFNALREANPGVDPSNVRPGQHLSVPAAAPQGTSSPIASAATLAINEPSGDAGSSHPYIVSPGYASYDQSDNNSKVGSFLGADPRGDQYRKSASETRAADKAPVWLNRSPEGGHYAETSRLTFQKQSAMRIRNAGYQLRSEVIPSPDSVPAARFTKDAATVLVPDHSGYKLPDYSSIGKLSHDAKTQQISFPLKGAITSVEGGCVILKSIDNETWRLAMPSSSEALVGKTVTAWGVGGAGASCGEGPSMLVSHIVYAEPWHEKTKRLAR